MTAEEIDIEQLRGWIGREESAEDALTPELAKRYHATFERKGPPPGLGELAPRLIHWCLAQPAAPASELGLDGHPARGGFLPPVALPRRMWAGGAFEFFGDLRVGDAVRRRSTIDDVVLKQGRTGRLCFVTVGHEVSANGQPVLRERQDIVYRDPPQEGGPKKELPAAAEGKDRRRIEPTTTLLFRYSAMTFNGHRIHYDRDHAVKTEGYDGLVVHGPMQAALMLMFAEELRGAPPSSFSFRGASPLTDTAPFYLNAAAEADEMRLWTARDGGPEGMLAEARWS